MELLDRIVRNMGNLCTAPAPRSSTSNKTILEDDVNSGVDISTKYKLKGKIGSGTFGITYLCKEISTGNEFACKIISKKCFQQGLSQEHVRQEIGIMRYLPKHSNIVGYKESFEDKKNIYVIMELCKGRDVFTWKRNKKGLFDEKDVAVLFAKMVEAVKFCHDYGVIHRDLKAENFMFKDKKEKAAEIKLIDFGLSTTFYPDRELHELVGSPSYIAPEVLLGTYGSQADIWSLGIMLYNLLSRRSPFINWGQPMTMQIINSIIDFEDDPWPKISKDGKNLVRRMLIRDPKLRITAEQVLAHRWFKQSQNDDDEEDVTATRRGRRMRNN